DDQVGAVFPGQFDRSLAVPGLADDRVALLLGHLFEIEPDQRLVLGDDDARGHRGHVRLVVFWHVDGLGRLGGTHVGSLVRGRPVLLTRAYRAAVRWVDGGRPPPFVSKGAPVAPRWRPWAQPDRTSLGAG